MQNVADVIEIDTDLWLAWLKTWEVDDRPRDEPVARRFLNPVAKIADLKLEVMKVDAKDVVVVIRAVLKHVPTTSAVPNNNKPRDVLSESNEGANADLR